MIADGCSYADAGRGGACRRAGGAQARSTRAACPHCRRRGKCLSGRTGRQSRRGSRPGSPLRPAPRRSSIFSAPTIADPTRPDIYTIAAADILHKDPSAITKTERGIGKVSTLALGFGGSVGALQRMALNYRIHLDDAEARRIVDAWREANPWAREFWGAHRDGESFGLWGAAMRAWEMPGQITTAGRIAFVYREDYLGGVAVHGVAVRPPADLSATALARCRHSRQGRQADRREAPASCRSGAPTGARSYGTALFARTRSRPPPPTSCARR